MSLQIILSIQHDSTLLSLFAEGTAPATSDQQFHCHCARGSFGSACPVHATSSRAAALAGTTWWCMAEGDMPLPGFDGILAGSVAVRSSQLSGETCRWLLLGQDPAAQAPRRPARQVRFAPAAHDGRSSRTWCKPLLKADLRMKQVLKTCQAGRFENLSNSSLWPGDEFLSCPIFALSSAGLFR